MFVEMYVLFMLASLFYVQFGIRADGTKEPHVEQHEPAVQEYVATESDAGIPDEDRWRNVWQHVNTSKSFEAWYAWCQERSMSLEKLEQRIEA